MYVAKVGDLDIKFCVCESVRTEKTLRKIIDYLLAEGYKMQVRRLDVERAIMRTRGVDQRTIDKWLKALIVFEYLKPIGAGVYQLNPFRIPELLRIIKEKPQSKLQ